MPIAVVFFVLEKFYFDIVDLLLLHSTIVYICTMKPAIVADEMFPEGAGPYMDLEEVLKCGYLT